MANEKSAAIKSAVSAAGVKDKVPVLRQIIIETDGKNVNLAKAEVYGVIEMVAILNMVINAIQNQNTQAAGTSAAKATPEASDAKETKKGK